MLVIVVIILHFFECKTEGLKGTDRTNLRHIIC